MIRISIAAASLALLAATNPGVAEDWNAYKNSMQHQSGTYDSYKPSYDSYKPSYGGYSYDDGYRKYGYRRYGYGKRYGYDDGSKYSYGGRYGYGYRCTYNCY